MDRIYDRALQMDVPVPHDDGSFVSERVSRIVELIREYDSRLEVRWIPPAKREPGEPAFAICEHTIDGRIVVAFTVEREEDFNENILARIIEGDNTRGDVLTRMEARNEATRLLHKKEQEERMAAAHDMAATIMKSPLHSFKHNGIDYGKKYGGRRD